jgi:hypothetical protein
LIVKLRSEGSAMAAEMITLGQRPPAPWFLVPQAGFVEGRNIRIEYRWADGQTPSGLREHAHDLPIALGTDRAIKAWYHPSIA